MKISDFRIILFFIKDYKRYIIGVLLFSMLYAIFEGLNIAVLFPLINMVINASNAEAGQGIIMGMLNRLIGLMPLADVFISTCLLVIIIVLFKNLFRYFSSVLGIYASYRIWNDVQKKLFHKYINADYRYFLDHKHGEIFYRASNVPASAGGLLKIIPQLLTEILKIAVIMVMLFSMSFSVTCGVIVIAAVFYFFTRGIAIKVSYSLGKGRVQADEEENIVISEMINGIKPIKIFLAEKKWISKFYRAMDTYFNFAKRDTLWLYMPVSALEIFALTSLSLFLIFIRKFSPQSLLGNLPLLGVFAYAFQRVMPSLSMITTFKMQIMSSLPALEILYEVVNEKMTHLKDGSRVMGPFRDKIEFHNVSFLYPGKKAAALKNVSISFEKNRSIAIVGPSGSGKTTIANLLIRLFDPTEGAILVDGIDLKDYKRGSWLAQIGFVSQDTFIFHASVRDNIAFGLEGADDRDIEKAAKMANAHDFISRFPDGYGTIVGEKGMKLSGGEQQRLAIARAILRNPQILIFDEATSALDNVSQSLIQQSINHIMKDHTVILIAHRLSTIVNADKIIVLDQGEVKEVGSHAKLISEKSFYWRLYNHEDSVAVEH